METTIQKELLIKRMATPRRKTSTRTVKQGNKFLYQDSKTENTQLLQRVAQYWYYLDDFRTRTERAWRYRRGKQWDDFVYDPDTGENVREYDLIANQGQIPFVINMIAPLVKNLKGQFRSSKSKPNVMARSKDKSNIGEMITAALWYTDDINQSTEVDANGLEIFLDSGACIQRADYKFNEELNKMLIRRKNCELATMFFNQVTDQQLSDLYLIGEFHDMTMDDIVSVFAKTKDDEKRLREIYSYVDERQSSLEEAFTEDQIRNKNFYTTNDPNKGRVFEIWEKVGDWYYWYHDWQKGKYGTVPMNIDNKRYFDSENAKRLQMAQQYGIPQEEVAMIEYNERYIKKWKFKFVSPTYETLLEGFTPYRHNSHPYIVILYPLVRGEVWGFVEDIIDIQRGFNRDKIMLDFVIGSSSKGTLVVDENSISDDFQFDDIVDAWSRRNGVIKMNLKAGAQLPQHLVSHAIPAGLNESLQLGMSLMDRNSGVSDAIQGRNVGSGTPASLYAQSAQNSTINSKDYMDAYNSFRVRAYTKVVSLMVQFYNDKMFLNNTSKSYSDESRLWDPSLITDDIESDVSVGMGADSQVYRSIMDEWLNQYVVQGLIPVELMLKHTSLPFADQLLKDIQEMKKQAQMGGMPQGASGNDQMLQNTVNGLKSMGADASQANPQAVNLMKRYMGMDQEPAI